MAPPRRRWLLAAVLVAASLAPGSGGSACDASRLRVRDHSSPAVAQSAFLPVSRASVATARPPGPRALRGGDASSDKLMRPYTQVSDTQHALPRRESEVHVAVDPTRAERTACSPERDGWYPYAYPVVNESLRVCVQQVQGCGDCLFHAIAVGEAYAKRGEHIGMYDTSLEARVAELRQLAVDTLVDHADQPLAMEGDEWIQGGELVETVAEQYGLRPDEYLDLMRKPRVWGGGPEIIALVNAIEHPIYVYEPVCANNGTEIHLSLSGKYGSPRFDHAHPIHVLAADDKFPHCGPTEFKLHGEGGNHFLALIPVANSDSSGVNC